MLGSGRVSAFIYRTSEQRNKYYHAAVERGRKDIKVTSSITGTIFYKDGRVDVYLTLLDLPYRVEKLSRLDVWVPAGDHFTIPQEIKDALDAKCNTGLR